MPSKPILVVTRHFTDAVETRIARDFEARRNPNDRALTPDELIAAAEGADALFISPAEKLDATFFARVPKSVKAIATFSVGYDHIDLAAAKASGIPVSNTPGVLNDATADVAMLLLLGASRRAYESQQLVRSGEWPKRKPADLLGWQLTGSILGIYGMGRIGQALAHRARAFGMTIHYNNRKPLPESEAQGAIFHDTPESLLRASNFLSIHAPSSAETKHFLNRKTIDLLPQGAIVINTARGALVNDEDLIAALRSGRIAAAGLDVFEGEPNVNPGYLDLPNAYLLPHIGSATIETRTAMGMLALDNIQAVLNGQPPPTPIPLP
ncbi:lactate dehydrogenase-like oxidoreductase [Terriglobus roseus DSM 18391]|uniref:Lactate dehydrogenase-like oxidoreductase n=1 Tax=Terriglobus roseus (strain DSM 18391 / NRRL B-41598 / KBS 63) TaxID=926566 RepID=I3ZER6_TERRK|nr:D-glycerate dehydrogenase [Terriglobus roseus]AFL87734.1 lactate dehydrogenase-like oxidoreductase [Terriglobus roseus DSM 18391]